MDIRLNNNWYRTMGSNGVKLNPPSQYLKAHSGKVFRRVVGELLFIVYRNIIKK